MRILPMAGLSLMMLCLLAIPVAAENYHRDTGNHWKSGKRVVSSGVQKHRQYNRRSYQKAIKKEQKEYRHEQKKNIKTFKRADTPRERKKLNRAMVANWRNYRQDVRKIRHDYHENSNRGWKASNSDGYRVRAQNFHPNYIALGFWY